MQTHYKSKLSSSEALVYCFGCAAPIVVDTTPVLIERDEGSAILAVPKLQAPFIDLSCRNSTVKDRQGKTALTRARKEMFKFLDA